MLDRLALLESAPELLRDLLRSRPLHIKLAVPRDRDTVAVAGNTVIHTKRIDHIRPRLELLPRLRELLKHKRKRKLRRDRPERADNPFQPSDPQEAPAPSAPHFPSSKENPEAH